MNTLVFCSDCKHFVKIGECKKGHNIDEITPSKCKDGIELALYDEFKIEMGYECQFLTIEKGDADGYCELHKCICLEPDSCL